MDLTQEKARLEKELATSTEQLTALSSKCHILKAKIRRLDKGIESNKKLLDELNGNTEPKEPE